MGFIRTEDGTNIFYKDWGSRGLAQVQADTFIRDLLTLLEQGS